MFDICCIGHITSDKVVNTQGIKYMPGGTAWYFSCALSKLPVNYLLATALAEAEMQYVDSLRLMNVEVMVQPSAKTVFFENIYGENQDDRTQRVLATADTFSIDQFEPVNAKIYHLGPLLAGDISTGLIKYLSGKAPVSVDVQGYLRRVEDQKVYTTDWADKQNALQYIHTLKADETELQALTGLSAVKDGVLQLAERGVKEIIITNGSHGSLLWHEDTFYQIPAYIPDIVLDATGCGDTYMAGYLYSRSKNINVEQSGHFAAAMAGLKTATAGPFVGTVEDVENFLAPKH